MRFRHLYPNESPGFQNRLEPDLIEMAWGPLYHMAMLIEVAMKGAYPKSTSQFDVAFYRRLNAPQGQVITITKPMATGDFSRLEIYYTRTSLTDEVLAAVEDVSQTLLSFYDQGDHQIDTTLMAGRELYSYMTYFKGLLEDHGYLRFPGSRIGPIHNAYVFSTPNRLGTISARLLRYRTYAAKMNELALSQLVPGWKFEILDQLMTEAAARSAHVTEQWQELDAALRGRRTIVHAAPYFRLPDEPLDPKLHSQ
jgi:hypothetical protein